MPQARRGPTRLGPQREGRSLGTHRGQQRGRLHQPQAVARQAQLAHHRGRQAADRVGQERHAGAGRDLRRDQGTADPLTPLQEERAQAAARQVGGADEAVVAAADDDDVLASASRSRLDPATPLGQHRQGRQATRARP